MVVEMDKKGNEGSVALTRSSDPIQDFSLNPFFKPPKRRQPQQPPRYPLHARRSRVELRTAEPSLAWVALSKLSVTITVLSGHSSTITGPSSVETRAAPTGQGATEHAGTSWTLAFL